tara:strand:+ start:14897 stop:16330 length:1434 start_codon:yes stop_codon:yes gene_type:complete
LTKFNKIVLRYILLLVIPPILFFIYFSSKEVKISPNFILIVADDQGWNGTSVKMMNKESLSKSDYYETPNLEILASRGMKFSNAYASAPVCAPSRYSIQFGKSPARLSLIRVGMNSSHINHDEILSIPKALKNINKDYATAHFGKWGMDSSPELIGYDESDGPTKNKDGGFTNDKNQWISTVKKDPKKIFSITNKAVEFMKKNALKNTPFFMQISHFAVHSSFQMKDSTLNKYNLKNKGKYQKNAGLAAMTEDLDDGLGIILQNLKNLEIEDNTYIIYISDNGSVPNVPGAKKYTYSYNYPLSRGKWDAMEGGIRIPFIISGPRINGNEQCDLPVSCCDLLPTIMSLVSSNYEIPLDIDGGSLKSILMGNENGEIERSVNGIFFHVPYKNKIALNRPHSAVRNGNYKLIKFHDNHQVLLFNMLKDLSEKNDISKIELNKKKELEKILDDYLRDVHALKWKEGINWKNVPIDNINSFY